LVRPAHCHAPRMLVRPAPHLNNTARSIFGWFDAAFNKYDPERVAEVGLDRAAAEWILRCGGSVTWHTGTTVTDYNSLPVGRYRQFKITAIDGTDSCVMEAGFEHLRGLTELRRVVLVNNKYLSDDSISFLVAYTKNRLEQLHLAGNGNITAGGLLQLGRLQCLQRLQLGALHEVRGPQAVLQQLQTDLPGCSISWPPFTQEEESK